MTLFEIVVAISGLAIGYWLVGVFVSSSRPGTHESTTPDDASSDDGTFRHWTDVLGVPFDAGEEQVTSAYRRAIAQHHPDRVATMAPEIQELARRRTTEINAAYDEAMRSVRR